MAANVALQVLVSPLLGTVFDNLSSLIQSEFSLVWGLKKDLQKFSNTLSTIQVVIEDAEDKQITDKLILMWLRKLKDAAYDAEDVLDDCSTEALEPSGSETMEVLNKSSLSCFVFKRIMFRRAIGKRIKHLIRRFDEIANERLKFHLNLSSLSNNVEARVNQRETSPLLVEPHVYGRDDEKEYLVNLLLVNNTVEGDDPQREGNLSVCPILGMGGLGKTTLTQMVYNDSRIADYFEVRCWVCVSENFNVKTLLRDIIISCGGKSQELDKLNHLQNRLQGTLSGKRFLLVLDDVWNEDQSKWDKLKSSLACAGKGSSIIVTTRLQTVAKIMRTLPICSPKVLSEEECWLLLRHRAFGVGNEDSNCNPSLEAVGKEIVKKCGGIPLAAKALGGLLRFKREVREWLFVRDSKTWDLLQDKEDAILPALMLSYNHLSSNSKQCFIYCSIFPKDYRIEKEKLIELWMANGFIQANGRGMELEDIGSEIFDDLLWRSFFQDAKKDQYEDIESCKMHDLVHDLACSIMENDCSSIVQFADVKKKVGTRTRHLILNFRNTTSSSVAHLESSTKSHLRLRSFILMNTFPQPKLSLPKFECLRILDLNNMNITTVPISICELKHLRYLDLSHTRIKSLPESICELKNLQTLRLTRSFIEVLPKKMNKMTSLRHLYINECYSLTTSMPFGMRQLTSLQTLSKFIVGKESGRGINELHGFNHLRGELRIQGLDKVRDVMDAKSANLMRKENLHKLDLIWSLELPENSSITAKDVREEELIEEGLQPHPNIRRISIENYGGRKIPSWMMLLPNLVSVTLMNCRRCESLPPLGQLPLLRFLHVSGLDALKSVGDEFCGDKGFPKLERLLFYEMPNLEKLWPCSSSEQLTLYPKLKYLEISIFPKLIMCTPFPSSLETLRICDRILTSSLDLQSMTGMKILLQDLSPKVLNFCYFNKLKTLPIELLQNRTHEVKILNIVECNELAALPNEFPNLVSLVIIGCPGIKLFHNDMQHLVSLRYLHIQNCLELKSLGEGLQNLAGTLDYLVLSSCSALKGLPEWIGSFTLLRTMQIIGCENLQYLPEGLKQLTSLKTLVISDCHPGLHRRCTNEKGEDWHKISHIPDLNIIENSNDRKNVNCIVALPCWSSS